MAHLSLALLGPLRIALNDQPLTTFESDKVRALLMYLALEAERPQRRATLADMFWPDQPERVGRHNLSQALFNLRQTIGDHMAQPAFLLISRDTVQFNLASDHSVDVTTFSALIDACDAHRHRQLQSCATCAKRLAAAIGLYRGDFLAQFALADSVAFEEWSLLKRERLGQAASRALTVLTTYHELRGDYRRAADLAQRQLALDPWHESAHRQLMRVLARDGQRAAALVAYDRCRKVLADQLGVEPDDETTALYEQIRDAEDELPLHGEQRLRSATRPHNLPAQLTPFIGREHELMQIGDMLANPQCRLITISGPGGIGKTRLAFQVALEQLDVFPDGVFFVSLAQVYEPDLLSTAVANALGLMLNGADPPHTQLLSYLREKELLLLLDNFEHLLGAASSLSHLLRAAPGITLLVTSRARLDLQGEWLVEVGGLSLPDEEHSATIEHTDAGQLWVQTARRVHAGYTMADDDRPIVARICRMVEGTPLAIELAAAWIRVFACREIAQEIARGLALLTTTARDVPERHRSFQAVLDHSWTLLTDAERSILRQLAVFRGGFQREAAEQIVGASIAQLATLADKSLLRSVHTTGQRRYDLHELIRQYAFGQLEAAGETEQTRNHHLSYFLALAEQAAMHFSGAEEGSWLARLDVEHDNLRSALDWAFHQGKVDLAARICGAIWRFWHIRGYLAEGRQWIARVLMQADTGEAAWVRDREAANHPISPNDRVDKPVRAHVLKGAGVLAWAQSDYLEAKASFEESLILYQELADTDGIAAVSSNLGVLAMYQGDYERANRLLQASLRLRRERGDRWGTAACLHNLGAMAGKQGEPILAQTYYQEGLALYRELGHARGIAILLTNLGDVAEAQGQSDEARRLSTESLAIRRQLGDRAGIATALTRLGALALRRNDIAQAQSYYAESLTLLQALGDKEYLAICFEGCTALAAAQQQWERAACLWGAAEALRAAIKVPLPPSIRAEYEPRLSTIRKHLDEEAFRRSWAEGQAMSVEQAIVYALEPA